jgi:ABC-type sugar transport system ATPase subunit
VVSVVAIEVVPTASGGQRVQLRSRSETAATSSTTCRRRIATSPSCFRVYVTHDQFEAITLADRVMVMNHGPNAAARGPLRLAVDLNNMHLLNEVTGAVI